MGGKYNLATYLLPYVLSSNPKTIVEPFLGGGNFMVRAYKEGFSGSYIAGDYDKDNSFMWKSVLEGWLPKYEDRPTREEYQVMKKAGFSENPVRGFARSVAAFGSNPWRGYALDSAAKDGTVTDYWRIASNAMKRDADIIVGRDIKIVGGDYSDYTDYIDKDCVVYCDPPYMNTGDYHRGDKFNYDRFWDTVREWSKVCPVYVSELTAPADFVAVYEKLKTHQVNAKHKEAAKKVSEKLFIHEPSLKNNPGLVEMIKKREESR